MGYKVNKIRVGTQQVRPSGWTPGANTVAYYPLTSQTTVNDMSGNGKNLTKTGTVQFGTYGGVSCVYTQNSHSDLSPVNYLSNSNISLPTNLTVSLRVQSSVNKINVTTCWTFGSGRPNLYGLWIGTYYNNGEFCIGDFSGQKEKIWTNVGISSGNWYNIICCKEGETSTLYKNGSLVGSYTGIQSNISSLFLLCDTYSSGGLTGYMSEVILENKARTAQEVLNYYNQTKSNYGL